jgi:hypothetical protein
MKVAKSGVCSCLYKATGFDLWGDNDLSFIAKPVHWYGKLAKIILVGVRYKDSQLLETQREGLYKPFKFLESYQLI